MPDLIRIPFYFFAAFTDRSVRIVVRIFFFLFLRNIFERDLRTCAYDAWMLCCDQVRVEKWSKRKCSTPTFLSYIATCSWRIVVESFSTRKCSRLFDKYRSFSEYRFLFADHSLTGTNKIHGRTSFLELSRKFREHSSQDDNNNNYNNLILQSFEHI